MNPNIQPPIYAGGQPPPRRRRTGRNIVLITLGVFALMVGLLVIAAAVGGRHQPTSRHKTNTADTNHGALTSSDNPAHPPPADVAVTACTVDEVGFAHAKLTITNHSGKPSDYMITVEFTAGAIRVAEGVASQSAVAAGQVAQTEAIGDQEVHGQVTCRITQVNRLAS